MNIGVKVTTSNLYFADTAQKLVDKGWSVYPQTSDTRQPGRADGVDIRPVTDYNLDTRLPTKADIRRWSAACGDHNVACMMGAGSGNAVAIDIDITDAALSKKAQEVAAEIFGETPLKRTGKAPKIALIYRASGKIYNASPVANEDGHAIEILASGKALTFFGSHHSIGRPFKWSPDSPLWVTPEELPEITQNQINEFFIRVNEFMPLSQGSNVGGYDEFGAYIPPWTDNEEGKITDGREKYLFTLVRATCSEWAVSGRLRLDGRDVLNDLIKEISDKFAAAAVLDGRWEPERLHNEIAPRVVSMVKKLADGTVKPNKNNWNPTINIRKKVSKKPVAKLEDGDAELKEASEVDNVDAKINKDTSNANAKEVTEEPDDGLSILTFEQHEPMMKEISRKISETIDTFLDECSLHVGKPYDETQTQQDEPNLYVLMAAVGFGKTTGLIRRLASDPRTYQDVPTKDGAIRAPYVMLVPTYRNVDEIRQKAEIFGMSNDMSNEELIQRASAVGLLQENDLEGMSRLRARIEKEAGPGREFGGFTVGTYQGRVRAGCKMHEQMALASLSGLSGGSLCKKALTKKEKEENPDQKEHLCQYYNECPAIRQAQIFNSAHLVMMPHAFLGLNIPEIAQNVRGVIVDERAHDLFLHTTQMPFDTLKLPRAVPHMSKKEKLKHLKKDPNFSEDKWQSEILLCREEAVHLLNESFINKTDIAQTLNDLGGRGTEIIEACKNICANSMRRERDLEPNMTLEDIEKIVAMPTGKHAREEWRLWKIIHERMSLIEQAKIGACAYPSGGSSGDVRIQLLHAKNDIRGKRIRLSWRTSPNWLDKPVLLLDASANQNIIQKVWAKSPEHVLVTNLLSESGLYRRMQTYFVHAGGKGNTSEPVPKTFSNSLILGTPSDTPRTRIAPAKVLDRIHGFLSSVAIKHGLGRVLVGSNIPVRKALNECWEAPVNVDFGHYGALRGIDVYKGHQAAVSIGRLEIPIDVMDGIVASLTYDDEAPETPIDVNGTGYIGDEQISIPMQKRAVQIRNGNVMEIDVPVPDGFWASIVQAQYREEELIQFLGRLRPFHRHDTPTYYAISSVLPPGIIVDQVISIETPAYRYGRAVADAFRLGQGSLLKEKVQPEKFGWNASILEDSKKMADSGNAMKFPGWQSEAYTLKSDTRGIISDKLDETIGLRAVRRRREAALMRSIFKLLGREEPMTANERRMKYPVPNIKNCNEKLTVDEIFSLSCIGVFHQNLSNHYSQPDGIPNNEDRDYSELGSWEDNVS